MATAKYGYHRTDIKNVAGIIEKGFRPGFGTMYGSGWYMCYDLQSQLKGDMDHYGNALIKSRIFEKGCIIFDYNLAKQYYGSRYTIVDQLLANRFYASKSMIPIPWLEISDACELSLADPRYSATIAYNCFVEDLKGSYVIESGSLNPCQNKKNTWGVGSVGLKNNVPRIGRLTGIMFTGNHDGNVYVCYDPKSAIPEEYALLDGSERNPSDINWKSTKEFKQDIQKGNKSAVEILYNRYNDLNKLGIDPELFKKYKYDVDLFIKDWEWFFKAKKKNIEVFFTKNGRVHVQGGTWVMGTFEDGHMENSTFFGGTWKQGNMIDSEVKAGNILDGEFYGVTFYGGNVKAKDNLLISGGEIKGGNFYITRNNVTPSNPPKWTGGFMIDSKNKKIPCPRGGVEDLSVWLFENGF